MASVFLQNEVVADKINVGDAEQNEDISKELASRRTPWISLSVMGNSENNNY